MFTLIISLSSCSMRVGVRPHVSSSWLSWQGRHSADLRVRRRRGSGWAGPIRRPIPGPAVSQAEL